MFQPEIPTSSPHLLKHIYFQERMPTIPRVNPKEFKVDCAGEVEGGFQGKAGD
jgi:hypothetical protein